MLKEIYEQPRAVRDTTLGRVGQETGPRLPRRDGNHARTISAASSRSRSSPAAPVWHAALAGKVHDRESWRAFRWRWTTAASSAIAIRSSAPETLTVVISQSGETADTLAAQRESKQKGLEDARDLQRGRVHDHARGARHDLHARRSGDRRGLHQGVHLPVDRAVPAGDATWARCAGTLSDGSSRAPGAGTAAPARQAGDGARARCAGRGAGAALFQARTDFLFLGRGIHFPIALEGALKLKEISYIHAEGYPAGEMKHGPNALIDEKLPVVVIATRDPATRRASCATRRRFRNIQEVKARDGIVIAVVTEGDQRRARDRPTT